MSGNYNIHNQFGKLIYSNVCLDRVTKEDSGYILFERDRYGHSVSIGYIPLNWAIIQSSFFNAVE